MYAKLKIVLYRAYTQYHITTHIIIYIHKSRMLNYIMVATPRVFINDFLSFNTYILIGIIIWLAKVGISTFLICPSTTRYLENRNIFILLVFFSPNIVFWPINILMDIYALTTLILENYFPSQIINADA